MATPLPEPLRQAAAWLRANPLAEARALLVGFSREQPESDQGWYLPSLAVTDAARQVDCLQRVVRLNQNHSAARERLAEPQAQSGAPAARSVTAPQQTSEPGRPPAWTATPLPPPTPSPSLAPLSTPTPNPAFLPPDATQAVQMDKIEQQLADLRGLKLEVRQPRFLIPRPRVEEVLRGQPGAGAGGATAESADDVERAGADQAHP